MPAFSFTGHTLTELFGKNRQLTTNINKRVLLFVYETMSPNGVEKKKLFGVIEVRTSAK